ncbi:MAG: chemotaxis protein CheX, partial [Sulfurimonas sp.]|nr:chemotaxis protein CheX [Sulfurimonas sp.]
MRAVVKDGIATFSPQGFLDGNNANAYLSIEDVEAAKNLKTDMILVSLKKVVFFNRNGLDIFIKLFSKIRKKNIATVGFCDYDQNKYDAIMRFYKGDINFSLFKTLGIAYLFSSSYKNLNKSVLIYSEDGSQRSAIAIELHDNGHSPSIAKSLEEYNERKNSFDYEIDLTFLGQMGQKIATRVSGNAIIYTVSSFLDIEISDNFNIEYHNNSLNVGFRLFIFDAYKVISMNVHALNFFSRLSTSAAEYNATICFVGMKFDKTQISFKENMEDAGILFYNHMDDILQNKKLLKELGASSAANIKNKRTLNKESVIELPKFINAAAVTIEMMTNSKAVKESAAVQSLTIDKKEGKIASSIGYYGDLDGMVVLVFPSAIAKKACELLIGEDTNDIEL